MFKKISLVENNVQVNVQDNIFSSLKWITIESLLYYLLEM